MYGINEDAYWDQYQVAHDPHWYDADEACDVDQWDQVDMEVDEILLAKSE